MTGIVVGDVEIDADSQTLPLMAGKHVTINGIDYVCERVSEYSTGKTNQNVQGMSWRDTRYIFALKRCEP